MLKLKFTPKMSPKESQLKMREKKQDWECLLLSIRLDMSKNDRGSDIDDCGYIKRVRSGNSVAVC